MAHELNARITRVEKAVLHGRRPRAIGRNALSIVDSDAVSDPVVRLHTDQGVGGWGWSEASRDEATRLVGTTVADLFDPGAGTIDDFLRFDFALWDLAGHLLGRPVYEMLGARRDELVPVYDTSIWMNEWEPGTGRFVGIDGTLEGVRLGQEAGFRDFKIKIGRNRWMEPAEGVTADAKVALAVRDLAGSQAQVMVDVNNGYTPEQARSFMEQAADADLFWFEEPFPEDNDGYVEFAGFMRDKGWRTVVADGEWSEDNVDGITEIVRSGGIGAVQFHMANLTLTGWCRYMSVIEETRTLAAPHNWSNHLPGFYVVQFGRAVRRFATSEIDRVDMPAVDSSRYRMVDGKMSVPGSPGFGLDLDVDSFASALESDESWSVP